MRASKNQKKTEKNKKKHFEYSQIKTFNCFLMSFLVFLCFSKDAKRIIFPCTNSISPKKYGKKTEKPPS